MKAVSLALQLLIRSYQLLVSPFFPPCCRYFPSCSDYARQAVCSHGPLRGGWLSLRRLLRCHPWGGLGYDPVPEPAGEIDGAGRLKLGATCHHLDHQAGR